MVAGGELPVRRSDLPLRQSPAERDAQAGTHQAPAPRPLGNHAGAELHLRPPQPRDRRTRSQHDLYRGPGTRWPGIVANVYLEGTYTEFYPGITQDEEGIKLLSKQFSFPGGIPSHVAPETPGSIHEGGELGYALSHAFGAALNNPGLLVAVVVGDGEAETGALATSWHSNKFLNPARDGAVLPILHLNGAKIAGPTVLARIPHKEMEAMFRGFGYEPYFVEGADPAIMHPRMASTLDKVVADLDRIRSSARKKSAAKATRPRWPMIALRSPKGWTGPKVVDGKPLEGTFRSHQVPLGDVRQNPAHLRVLEAWMKSYKPEELFGTSGRLKPDLAALAPKGDRRMGANPHANGGLLLRDLRIPDFREYAVKVTGPGAVDAEATRIQGTLIRDVVKHDPQNFRIMSPDETASNRWDAVFDATDRCFLGDVAPIDDHVAPDGRVMEMLSEHQCQGWLEGYLLTGRHGWFSSSRTSRSSSRSTAIPG